MEEEDPAIAAWRERVRLHRLPKCHKCEKPIEDGEGKEFTNHPNDVSFPPTWFHNRCFNRYQHYYGLDKPLD